MLTKPGEKAEVPTGVIVGSIIAGILLLLALVAILWKVRKLYILEYWDSKASLLYSPYKMGNRFLDMISSTLRGRQMCALYNDSFPNFTTAPPFIQHYEHFV